MKNKIIIGIATLSVLLSFGVFVKANPSFFPAQTATAAATSTVAFMTPGTGTTTLVYNSYVTGNNFKTDSAELLIQFSASSTASQLVTRIEYANGYGGNDCVASPTSCDWYEDTVSNVQNFSTSTSPISLNLIPSYSWSFATSTVGGLPGQYSVNASTTRATRALSIQTPTQYIRAVFSCGIGGANCGIWSQFIPSKQRAE